ncbi:innexin inx2-like [Centruroides sculpturatus]|uniref:innexin inx2-like n=1 Tax=Centruroides sculpturatus TaxID=218467 RepID=UPI000C6DBA7A|nr:innexin inx2-like [Centruroides sculpturatus]
MFDIFDSLRALLKVDRVSIDNDVFRLHYKFTVLILIAFSIVVTSRQYLGDPIDCIQNDDVPERVLETYCWIHTTFTLPEAFHKKVGVDVPHPGIDKYKPGEKRMYHQYYQWVCFVLFLQAILFYVPRYMWKSYEGNRIKNLILELNRPVPDPNLNTNKHLLALYLYMNLHYHDLYVSFYLICEFLNLGNVVGQMFLINLFLGGEFTKYGIDVIKFSQMEQENRTDPMVIVFPRMTKCTFHRFGSSGDIQRYDALCILPLNIINEKIYIFLWFWFLLLAGLSLLIILYRLIIIVWPYLRYLVLKSRCRLTSDQDLRTVMRKAGLGDWFIIYTLCKNIEPIHFRDVMSELAILLSEEKNPKKRRRLNSDSIAT